MAYVNENFFELKDNYLFAKVLEKTAEYKKQNPDAKIINLGVGDVTKPLVPAVIKAMHKAVEEMANIETFRGYGLVPGYEFLREKIIEAEYRKNGIDFDKSEIFVANGSKCDLAGIVELFSNENIVAITDPVYPVYRDTNIMAGRKIVYLEANEESGFKPKLPEEKVDIIYLCSPNNPTGTVLNKDELKEWVDYARENKAVILYDSVYESFITEENIPHSIYEIEGAKEVAIEFRSFSKLAGFTGIRCSFMVIPKELKIYNKTGNENILNKIWLRRQSTKFGGVSYIAQRGAEAVYSEEGQSQIKENIRYYLKNAEYFRNELIKLGFTVYGGKNSPYIWFKVPNNLESWEFFDRLLNDASIVGTPGAGFGKQGEGFFRVTAFGKFEDYEEAIKRISNLKI